MLGKRAFAVNSEGHSIRILGERRVRWKFVFSVVNDSQISLVKYRRHLK